MEHESLEQMEIIQKVREYKKDMDEFIKFKFGDDDLQIMQSAAKDISKNLNKILEDK